MPAISDILQFAKGQLFEEPRLPKTTFAGQTIVITGANTGLGFECAKQLGNLALDVSTLVIVCRTTEKSQQAKKQLLEGRRGSKTNILTWQVDMASYDSVKALVTRMQLELPRLNALVANAGISTNIYHTAENLESTLTINVVSTMLLAILAMPLLRSTAKAIGQPTHLTIVGSNVHAFADHTQLQVKSKENVFRTLSNAGAADMAGRYFLSKLVLMFLVRKLAQLQSANTTDGVVINCQSPGWCKTELFRQDDGGFMGRNMLKLIGRSPEKGARTLTSAIVAGKDSHGQCLSEGKIKRTSVFVRSTEGEQVQERLWSDLSEILNEVAPEALGRL